MKYLRNLILLLLANVSIVHGWNIRTNDGGQVPYQYNFLFSKVLKERCLFNEDTPVYLVTKSTDLENRLNSEHVDSETYNQILLLNKEFILNQNIKSRQNIKVCGLRQWLVNVTYNIADILHADVVSREFQSVNENEIESGSGADNIAENLNINNEQWQPFSTELFPMRDDENRVKLIIRGNTSDYPSFYGLANITLSHIILSQHGQSQSYALYGSGCTESAPYFALDAIEGVRNCSTSRYVTTHLNNVKLEDLSGSHPFLLRTEEGSQLYADQSQFVFEHHDTENLVETYALHLYKPTGIGIKNSEITNYGERGRAIFWEDINSINSGAFLKNIIINAGSENASITGIYLANPLSSDESPTTIDTEFPLINGVVFKEGISIGFYFSDNNFHLRANGNDNNQFESNGMPCIGEPDGTLIFVDDTVCTNNPVTTTTNSVSSETELYTDTNTFDNSESEAIDHSGCITLISSTAIVMIFTLLSNCADIF